MTIAHLSPFAAADNPVLLNDVEAAFQEASQSLARLQSFSPGRLNVPAGGHIQGIQLKLDPDKERYLAFLSHDSNRLGYVVVVSFPRSGAHLGQVLHVHQFEAGRLRHAGGIQLLDDILAVGLEDNWSKDRSEIQFWNTADPVNWTQLDHLTIRRRGRPKDKTAGAVGIIRHDSHVVVAVANWDSRAIDFYQSSTPDLNDSHCRFDVMGRWSVNSADTSTWQPDKLFASYQAINLVGQSDGAVFLLGFHQRALGRDYVDLYSVDLSVKSTPSLHKIFAQKIKLSNDNHFKYGGGVSIQQNTMWFLSTERSLKNRVRINLTNHF